MLLLLHHVNRPVGAALYSFAVDPTEPDFLLTYESEQDRGPVTVRLNVDGSRGSGEIQHTSNGSLAFQKYWYHIVVVHHGDQMEMSVNGNSNGVPLRPSDDRKANRQNRIVTKRQVDLAIYADQEPLLQPANVVKWVKVHRRPLCKDEIAASYRAAEEQVENGIKYPSLFHFNAGPYLNFATQDSINLLWETNFPAGAEVHYGTSRDLGQTIKVE